MASSETVLLLLSTLAVSRLGATAKLPGPPCEFDGVMYQPGEMWFPDILPPGCTTCVCSQVGGHVHCESRQCPQLDCTNKAVLPGDCCPTCTDNLPPKLELAMVAPSYAACYHDDIIRLHGEHFASSTTGVIPRTGEQCTLCTCQDGRVLCRLKTCPTLTCASPIKAADDCCLTCPNDGEKSIHSAADGSHTDCRYQSQIYRHGDTWSPKIGELKCIVCHCNNSKIDCEKSPCLELADQPCGSNCCNSCIGKDSEYADGRNCYFVYRHSSRRNYSIAFENMGTRIAEVLSWTIQSGYATKYERTLSEGIAWPRADALGVVRTKQYKRFKRRINRQMEKCKSACSRRSLQRQVRRLRKTLISTYDVTSC